MTSFITSALAAACLAAALPASAQVTFYEDDNFQGRSFTTGRAVSNFANQGFNDRASSVVVGSERWEVCQDAGYRGHCVVLRQGRYASLGALGLNDRISSTRAVARTAQVDDERYAPAPVADYRRRDNERIYQANVTSSHAVMGPPEQRCWVDRAQVSQDNREANVPGAIAGALLGGILGHQIGGGTGRDIATVGGVVAGAAVGSRVGGGRDNAPANVQRCANVPNSARPSYWDVTYNFRGQEHRMQMTTPPGSTVNVNRQGEPRA
jgi:uncharacterized protein YcfJ